jgi:hypothetical protein
LLGANTQDFVCFGRWVQFAVVIRVGGGNDRSLFTTLTDKSVCLIYQRLLGSSAGVQAKLIGDLGALQDIKRYSQILRSRTFLKSSTSDWDNYC